MEVRGHIAYTNLAVCRDDCQYSMALGESLTYTLGFQSGISVMMGFAYVWENLGLFSWKEWRVGVGVGHESCFKIFTDCCKSRMHVSRGITNK